jgi:hypothetical protein
MIDALAPQDNPDVGGQFLHLYVLMRLEFAQG